MIVTPKENPAMISGVLKSDLQVATKSGSLVLRNQDRVNSTTHALSCNLNSNRESARRDNQKSPQKTKLHRNLQRFNQRSFYKARRPGADCLRAVQTGQLENPHTGTANPLQLRGTEDTQDSERTSFERLCANGTIADRRHSLDVL